MRLDVELRIAAYLALMRCPNVEVLKSMEKFVNSEQASPEVGAFIYSHMNNLKKTSDPHKQDVAQAISKLV